MLEASLLGLGLIVIASGLSQWIAWKFHLPSILLLLVFGFLIGPVSGILHPDELFGEALFPFISLSVAVLLFEGGLSLQFSQLKGVGRVVRNLLSMGLGLTFLLSSLAAHWILGFSWPLSILLGSVLTVSGPTVVIPLLRHIRPASHIGSVLMWEGILIDSVGALLAILVFGFVSGSGHDANIGYAAVSIVRTLAFGTVIGILGGIVMTEALRRYWIPDFLHVSFSLVVVIAGFLASNAMQEESGLLAVTVMGIVLINQKRVSIEHIVEFKEHLRTLLIGALFIVLAARLHLSDLAYANLSLLGFVAALVFIVRPASVFLSARGTSLTMRERGFLSAMYPRGIVAAAVSSVFALRLSESGYPGAEAFAPVAFLTIVATVAVYGLSSLPIARLLGVAKPNPQGVLFAGADRWVLELGKALAKEGVAVRFIDEHWSNVTAVRMEGFQAHYARSIHEYMAEEVDVGEMGKLAALTASDELNSLIALHYIDAFGRKEVYQLPMDAPSTAADGMSPQLGGRALFRMGVTHHDVAEWFALGAEVKVTRLSEEHGYDDVLHRLGAAALPVCLIDEEGVVAFFTVSSPPKPKPGHRIVLIVPKQGTSA